MKAIVIAISLALGISISALAQIEITPLAGYTFRNQFNVSGGRAVLGDGFTWGGAASVKVGSGNEIEVLYTRQENFVSVNSRFLPEDFRGNTVVQYYMIGMNRIIKPSNESLNFYMGLKVGAMSIGSLNSEFATATRFAVQLGGGAKYFISDKVGIRAGMTLGFPIIDSGIGLWWSPGSGTSVNFSGWSPIVQFGFQGGLIFRLDPS